MELKAEDVKNIRSLALCKEFLEQAVTLCDSQTTEIAKLKARIAELEALNHDLCERVTENDEIRLHWEEIEQTRAENERLKARVAELEESGEAQRSNNG